MDEKITIYHGSENIIEEPIFGKGRKHNDFGLGFYCTTSNDLAKEWAVTLLKGGFSNKYILDTKYLNILNINSEEYSILNWIAILVEHRLFSIKNPITKKARQYLIDNFSINANAYDLIIGYRADDSYFEYAEAFLNNSITVEQLSLAMELGQLGEQIVIKSKYAFSCLQFVEYEEAKKEEYYNLRQKRNNDANNLYYKILEEENEGLYIQDIIKGGIKNNDPRIPRNISK